MSEKPERYRVVGTVRFQHAEIICDCQYRGNGNYIKRVNEIFRACSEEHAAKLALRDAAWWEGATDCSVHDGDDMFDVIPDVGVYWKERPAITNEDQCERDYQVLIAWNEGTPIRVPKECHVDPNVSLV